MHYHKIELSGIPVLVVEEGIESIPITFFKILKYWYFINYIFLWLRGGHETII